MRYLLSALILMGLVVAPVEIDVAWAQSTTNGVQADCGYMGGFLEPVAGFQSALAVSSVVVKPTIPAGTKVMIVQVESNSIRYTDDGTVVSSSVGVIVSKHTVGADQGIIVVCRPNTNFQMIRASADATVNISYYGVNQRNQ